MLFENAVGVNVTMNGPRYISVIFFSAIELIMLTYNTWFQQDGATCHTFLREKW